MKRKLQVLAIAFVSLGMSNGYAQEPDATTTATPTPAASTCDTKIDVGLDINSSYIWRGLKLGNGVSLQPTIELTSGGFTLGSFGNINTNNDNDPTKDPEAFQANLYTSYKFPFGVTLGINDYYYGGNYLGVNFENMAKTHSIEPTLKYDYSDNLSFFLAIMYMEGPTSDFYGEIAYDFDLFNFAIGAGDGQYTTSPKWNNGGDFGICNITISKEKNIKITDKFSLPIKGAVTLNPTIERYYAYVGISL